MKTLIRLSLVFFSTLILVSCGKEKEKDPVPEILKELQSLQEFKKAEKHIDSLNKEGIKAKISISVVKGNLLSKMSQEDVITIFVKKELGFADNILYTVTYDKNKREVIAKESNF